VRESTLHGPRVVEKSASMLKILSMLNWAMATLYGLVFGLIMIIAAGKAELSDVAVIAVIGCLLAGPHIYLGSVIERGRGRIVQTILAILSLLNFPLGTAFGAFALWVCWDKEHELFERGGLAAGEAYDPPSSPGRGRRPPRVEIEDEVTAPRRGSASSPYQLVQQLKKQGLKAGDIQEQLHLEGLSGEEIETLMTSTGLKFSKVKQKHLEEFS
jgi:hypothetical protein